MTDPTDLPDYLRRLAATQGLFRLSSFDANVLHQAADRITTLEAEAFEEQHRWEAAAREHEALQAKVTTLETLVDEHQADKDRLRWLEQGNGLCGACNDSPWQDADCGCPCHHVWYVLTKGLPDERADLMSILEQWDASLAARKGA